MSSRSFSTLILFLLISGAARGQLLDEQRDALGGGSWQGCDPSLEVEFSEELIGLLTYTFLPEVTAGQTIPYSNVWSVFDGVTFDQYFTETHTHSFQLPGEHLVCLTVNAFDVLAQQPCSTTTCRFVNVLQDTSCATLSADFELASALASTITFQDVSAFGEGIVQQTWSFGDGGTGQGASPSHTYYGSGPFKVCLSVSGPPPVACTSTVCKWLYLGAVPVPCDVVFEPGFIMVQQEGLVGVLDTSITSGMNNTISWDFGDGSPTEQGRFALHSYTLAGSYELCSTVRTWGPLLADTCVTITCRDVFVNVVGTEEMGSSDTPVRVWPNPVGDQLHLSGLEQGAYDAVLFDALGRAVVRQTLLGPSMNTLDLSALPGGPYSLQLTAARSRHMLRIIKH